MNLRVCELCHHKASVSGSRDWGQDSSGSFGVGTTRPGDPGAQCPSGDPRTTKPGESWAPRGSGADPPFPRRTQPQTLRDGAAQSPASQQNRSHTSRNRKALRSPTIKVEFVGSLEGRRSEACPCLFPFKELQRPSESHSDHSHSKLQLHGPPAHDFIDFEMSLNPPQRVIYPVQLRASEHTGYAQCR